MVVTRNVKDTKAANEGVQWSKFWHGVGVQIGRGSARKQHGKEVRKEKTEEEED